MPSPTGFYRAFGISSAVKSLGWHAVVDYTEHTPIVQYQSYKYRIYMTLYATNNASASSSISTALHKLQKKHPIVTTRYGNPYQCSITTIQVSNKKNHVVVLIKGKAIRV